MEKENQDLALELKAAERVTVRVSSKGFRVVEGKKGGGGGWRKKDRGEGREVAGGLRGRRIEWRKQKTK